MIAQEHARSMKTAQPHITEKQFQSDVEQAARLLGWLVYHTYDSRRCERGYPDLTLNYLVKRRIIFAELKSQRGHRPTRAVHVADSTGCLPECRGLHAGALVTGMNS